MKKVLALLLIFLAIFACGCLTDDDDDDDDDKGGSSSAGTQLNLKAEDYAPFAVGNTWTYHETGTNWGSDVDHTYVETIVGTETVAGSSFYKVTDTDGTEVYFRIADNAVYSTEWIPDVAAKPATLEAIKAQAEYKLMDFSQKTGASWIGLTYNNSDEYGTTSFTMTNTFVGLQDVTVPAGTFKDCPVFKAVVLSNYSMTNNGHTYNEKFETTLYVYLAKGVGPVKTSSKTTITAEGQASVTEDTVEQLTTYSLAE